MIKERNNGSRIVKVDEGLADGDVLDTGDRDNVAGGGGLGCDAFKTLGAQQLGDPDWLDRPVVSGEPHCRILGQRAVMDAQECEAPEERGGVEVRHMSLQRGVLIVGGAGDPGEDRLEERFEVLCGQVAVPGVVQGGRCRDMPNW